MTHFIDNGRTQNEILRERDHFDRHLRYLLHFLELDHTALDRWLIRQVLKTWDRQMAFLDPDWIRDKTVLDAGCGNPRVLFYFKSLGAKEVIGCDLSQRFVARGLRRDHTYVHTSRVSCSHDSVRLLYGDVNGPITAGLSVDTITCFQSLHHLDLDRFVDTCRRLLLPGGRVIISDPVGNHPLRRIGDWVGRLFGSLSSDERALPPKVVIARFKKNGFDARVFRALNPTLEIVFHLTELFTPLAPRLAFYSKLPMALLRPFENIIEALLLRRLPLFGWRYFLVMQK